MLLNDGNVNQLSLSLFYIQLDRQRDLAAIAVQQLELVRNQIDAAHQQQASMDVLKDLCATDTGARVGALHRQLVAVQV